MVNHHKNDKEIFLISHQLNQRKMYKTNSSSGILIIPRIESGGSEEELLLLLSVIDEYLSIILRYYNYF